MINFTLLTNYFSCAEITIYFKIYELSIFFREKFCNNLMQK